MIRKQLKNYQTFKSSQPFPLSRSKTYDDAYLYWRWHARPPQKPPKKMFYIKQRIWENFIYKYIGASVTLAWLTTDILGDKVIRDRTFPKWLHHLRIHKPKKSLDLTSDQWWSHSQEKGGNCTPHPHPPTTQKTHQTQN